MMLPLHLLLATTIGNVSRGKVTRLGFHLDCNVVNPAGHVQHTSGCTDCRSQLDKDWTVHDGIDLETIDIEQNTKNFHLFIERVIDLFLPGGLQTTIVSKSDRCHCNDPCDMAIIVLSTSSQQVSPGSQPTKRFPFSFARCCQTKKRCEDSTLRSRLPISLSLALTPVLSCYWCRYRVATMYSQKSQSAFMSFTAC
jgi:hypothetical protein